MGSETRNGDRSKLYRFRGRDPQGRYVQELIPVSPSLKQLEAEVILAKQGCTEFTLTYNCTSMRKPRITE